MPILHLDAVWQSLLWFFSRVGVVLNGLVEEKQMEGRLQTKPEFLCWKAPDGRTGETLIAVSAVFVTVISGCTKVSSSFTRATR